jgi:hypothetical protein
MKASRREPSPHPGAARRPRGRLFGRRHSTQRSATAHERRWARTSRPWAGGGGRQTGLSREPPGGGGLFEPKATIARLSALRVHALTTQSPHEVWVLLGTKDWAPGAAPSRLRRVRASGEALTAGVDRRLLDGIEAAIIDPAKTIADGFKYRSKVGLDLAIEALRNGLKRRIVKRPRLSDSARIWRVQSVMKPSVEAMV